MSSDNVLRLVGSACYHGLIEGKSAIQILRTGIGVGLRLRIVGKDCWLGPYPRDELGLNHRMNSVVVWTFWSGLLGG